MKNIRSKVLVLLHLRAMTNDKFDLEALRIVSFRFSVQHECLDVAFDGL